MTTIKKRETCTVCRKKQGLGDEFPHKVLRFLSFYGPLSYICMLNDQYSMNIGDQVRFLNDVGGGKITGFRPGGIVLVEDEDGFDVPVSQNEVVVIESQAKKPLPKPAPKVEYGQAPLKAQDVQSKKGTTKEESLNGKEYLQSKTVAPAEAEEEVDEQLEARVVRLELTIQKLEARIARLEAENNLRKNEKLMTRQAKPAKKPQQPTDLGDLKIL